MISMLKEAELPLIVLLTIVGLYLIDWIQRKYGHPLEYHDDD
ncbi:MAG: hypothetical protein WD535_02665 [Thermaerobacterales bacterium]